MITMTYNSKITGWMLESELKVLESIAQTVPENGTIVEVGSMFGKSSVCWALTAPTATVYCIDLYEDWEQVFNFDVDEDESKGFVNIPLKNVKYNSKQEFLNNTKDISNIIRIEGESPYNINYTGGEIDVFFLDAAHSNPSDWDSLCHFIPMVKEGGIVCGHDLHVFPDIMENVRRLEQILGVPFKHYSDGTVWSFKLDRKITKEEFL
jgi:predicted O-methyltransferase YrrM